MKTHYIPRGETRTYDSLDMERIVVHGTLRVLFDIKAKYITGGGIITAETVSADIILADEVNAERILCKRLRAKRVYSADIYASDSVTVSDNLTAAYVETSKLTTALSDVYEVSAERVINLRQRRRGMLLTLLMAAWISLRLTVTDPREKAKPKQKNEQNAESLPKQPAGLDADDAAMKEYIGKTVREIMAETGIPVSDGDTELKRIVSTFLLLRDQGYTLRVLPGTPEENAPVLDFAKEKLGRAAA